MRKYMFLLLSLLGLGSIGTAYAVPITGNITSCQGGGLTATAVWSDCGAVLRFEVEQLGNGNWSYEYTFGVRNKESSHFIIGVSDSFTTENIFTGTTAGWELGSFGDQGNANPGIPDLLYGIKFNLIGLVTSATIISDRAPTWNDFYAKDGITGGQDVFAYSTSFGQSSNANINGPAPFGFILGPDTVSTTVPEPSTLGLTALGFAGLLARYRQKRS